MSQPDKARLKLWVDALRSGQYEQGKRALAILQDDGTRRYCCLGIACEVAIANGLEIPTVSGHWKVYDQADLIMPQSVIDWYGLPSGDPELDNPEDPDADAESASALNDDLCWTFEHIADAVVATFGLEDTGERNGS